MQLLYLQYCVHFWQSLLREHVSNNQQKYSHTVPKWWFHSNLLGLLHTNEWISFFLNYVIYVYHFHVAVLRISSSKFYSKSSWQFCTNFTSFQGKRLSVRYKMKGLVGARPTTITNIILLHNPLLYQTLQLSADVANDSNTWTLISPMTHIILFNQECFFF